MARGQMTLRLALVAMVLGCFPLQAADMLMPIADVFVHGNFGQQKTRNTLIIQCDVSNTGSVAHSFPISLRIASAADSASLPFQSVTLKPGEFGTLTFHYTIPADSSLGMYNVTASVWQVEDAKRQKLGSRTDTQPFEVVLGEIQKNASVEVDPVGAPAPGSKLKIKCRVKNTGKNSRTFPVSLHLLGASEPIAPLRQSVTLDSKQKKEITFNLDMPLTGIDPNALLRVIVWDHEDDRKRLVMPFADMEVPLNNSAKTQAEVTFDTQIEEKIRGEFFQIVCNVKNTGDTRFQFPVKLEIRDSSDELAINPKAKNVILKPGQSKKVDFKVAVKEMGSYRALASVWKERNGKDIFITKFHETEQPFSIKNPAEGEVSDIALGAGSGQPPKVRLLDIVVAAVPGQKTPIRAQVDDPLGAVSCRLYYHLSTDQNIDFADMNLYSGDEKKGIWVGEVDLSQMEGKIVFYAEAANTESLVGRSKEYSLAKMATPAANAAPVRQ